MVPFVYLACLQSVQCLVSALTQAGGGGLLFRLLVPWRCGEGLALLSASTLLRLRAALYGACPVLRVVPQSADLAAPAFCVFPGPSSSGSQELDGRTLPGFSALSALRGPSLSFCPRQSGACAFSPPRPQPQSPPTPVGCMRPVPSRDPPGGCRPSRISGSLWLETGGLFAVW